MIYIQLFITFFLIGLFNFGGGNAMMALIQTQVVDIHDWVNEETFTDIVAISQMTPGPIGINCATFVGFEAGGFAGSFIATFAVVAPSFLIFFALVKFFERFHENVYFNGIMSAIKPSVAGMIAAAAVILAFRTDGMEIELIRDNFPDWKSAVLFGTSLAAGLFTKINPIYLILGAGVIGAIIY